MNTRATGDNKSHRISAIMMVRYLCRVDVTILEAKNALGGEPNTRFTGEYIRNVIEMLEAKGG